MKKDFTEIVFILDESGSMHSLKADTIGGFNSMLEKQKSQEGDAVVTTITFNSSSKIIHDRIDINKIENMSDDQYVPNGSTALFDAVGNAVEHISSIHRYARDEDRPEHTVFIITTDGMENSSRKFSQYDVKKMIESKKEEGWEFIFLGANIDAAQAACDIGIEKESAVDYVADSFGTHTLFSAVSNAISNSRMGRKNSECRQWRNEADLYMESRRK